MSQRTHKPEPAGRQMKPDHERMESVWRRRASRLSVPPTEASHSEEAVRVMVVGLGAERYGVELADVAEALPAVKITPVPGWPPLVAGVIHVHGSIRPVIDLRRALGIEAIDSGNSMRVILLRWQGREMGLRVDRVEGIRAVSGDEMQSSTDGYAGLSSRSIKGLTKDSLMALDTGALFAELGKETT